MRKRIPWLLLAFPVTLPSLSIAVERGIRVSVKTQAGASIALYEGSHALVVGNGNYTNGWDPLPGGLKSVEHQAEVFNGNGLEDIRHSGVDPRLDQFPSL
ncbi:MAG: hypothetical protein HY788_12380 [Deltaproteobacteria bacterium]|nr:hypothetical protein [Deltaproteobacteria bacterium]